MAIFCACPVHMWVHVAQDMHRKWPCICGHMWHRTCTENGRAYVGTCGTGHAQKMAVHLCVHVAQDMHRKCPKNGRAYVCMWHRTCPENGRAYVGTCGTGHAQKMTVHVKFHVEGYKGCVSLRL
jgi:6-phosphogluconate dehydrogenase (decarboxylating)